MFSLDNLAIQFPHAEVERVSVGMALQASVESRLGLLFIQGADHTTQSGYLSMLALYPSAF
jgi:hypothetical protein